MKIFGDQSHKFHIFTQEKGLLWGQNDVLAAEPRTVIAYTYSGVFGASRKEETSQPKIYLHINRSLWSMFTGILREYLLPWRWKAVYLDRENGQDPERILLCTDVKHDKLPGRLVDIAGQSLGVVRLIDKGLYQEVFNREYFRIPDESVQNTTINHPLGNWYGYFYSGSSHRYAHIFRVRGIISLIRYQFLKRFSSDWEEIALKIYDQSEKILIQERDREAIKTLRSAI